MQQLFPCRILDSVAENIESGRVAGARSKGLCSPFWDETHSLFPTYPPEQREFSSEGKKKIKILNDCVWGFCLLNRFIFSLLNIRNLLFSQCNPRLSHFTTTLHIVWSCLVSHAAVKTLPVVLVALSDWKFSSFFFLFLLLNILCNTDVKTITQWKRRVAVMWHNCQGTEMLWRADTQLCCTVYVGYLSKVLIVQDP